MTALESPKILSNIEPNTGDGVSVSLSNLTVPDVSGDWGAYKIKVPFRVDGKQSVTVEGTPQGGAVDFTLVEETPAQSGEYKVEYALGEFIFHSSDVGSPISSLEYTGKGQAVRSQHQNVVNHAICIPFTLPNTPAQTDVGASALVIPVLAGYTVANNATLLNGTDISNGGSTLLPDGLIVTGLSLASRPINASYISGDTTIKIANDVNGSETEGIEATILQAENTGVGAGSLEVSVASGVIHILVTSSGGHTDINGWIWLHRRITP